MRRPLRRAAPLLALALLLVCGGACRKRAVERCGPNLLLITLDTTRADRLGCYGHAAAVTPSLDALARQGARAVDAYTSVPLTLPSHATMLTGLYPIAHGVRNNGTYRLAAGIPTLAESLQAAGYDTAAFVAAYPLLAKFGLGRGFARYDDALDASELVSDYDSEIPADRVRDKFLAWLPNAAAAGRPFFAWVHFYDPHLPYRPHREFAGQTGRGQAGLYDGEIAFMDRQIGAILAQLRQRGLLARTLVVAAGDHGEDLGEHQEYGHGVFCYQESLRVPLILCQPGALPAGRAIPGQLNLVDLMPTLLELLGLPAPAGLQGESFAPDLYADWPERPRSFYFESLFAKEDMDWAPLTGFLSWPDKFISLPVPELYDLAVDPGERANRLPRAGARARELDRRLREFLARNGREAAGSRTALSAEDRRRLQALGYVSAFGQGRTGLDPKEGILVNNRLRAILLQVERGEFVVAAGALAAVRGANPGLAMPLLANLDYRIARGRGRLQEARAILVNAAERFPASDMFPMLLAKFDLENGDAAGAERTARAMLARWPDLAQGHVLLARIAEERGDKGEAAASIERALASEPGNAALAIAGADLHIASGDPDRALALYDSLLQNAEVRRSPEILFKIAMFQSRYGEASRAEALMRQVLALRPGGKYHFNFALILHRDGKTAEALASMRTARARYAGELSAEQRAIAEKAIAAWQAEGS
jgi:arylsulfatase A-like enzyme/predicted Zn-dependent protease